MLYYQTSPYLQLHNTGESLCVKNLVNDEVLQADTAGWRVLEHCTSPVKADMLVQMFDEPLFKRVTAGQFILETGLIWQAHRYRYVDIEVSTHCNWKCEYCPNRSFSQAEAYMGLQLFENIVQKLKDYGKTEYVTLNAFNEPTLDPYFFERLRILQQACIKLVLMTNGSYLDKKKADALKESNIIEVLWFNLPSVDSDVFRQMTGWHDFETVIKNIDYCIDIGLNVRFAVQGKTSNIGSDLQSIKEKYQNRVRQPIEKWETTDRAGLLDNEYNLGVNIPSPYMFGCPTALHNLCIGIGGEIMACFNDYHKEFVIGNINDGTIEEIATSPGVIRHKQKVFGVIPVEPGFICRKCIRMKSAKLLSRYMSRIRLKTQA